MRAAFDYWEACIEEAAAECDLPITTSQIKSMAGFVRVSSECYGDAFYQPTSPVPGQIKALEAALCAERAKVVCPECKGGGESRVDGPAHYAISRCRKCRGEGRVAV